MWGWPLPSADAASDERLSNSASLPRRTAVSPANPSSAGARRQCRCWLSGEGSICSRRRSSRLATEWPPVSGERMPTTRLNSTNFCASVNVAAAVSPALSRSSGASCAATSRQSPSEGTQRRRRAAAGRAAPPWPARPRRSWHDCENPLAMVNAPAGGASNARPAATRAASVVARPHAGQRRSVKGRAPRRPWCGTGSTPRGCRSGPARPA